MISDVKMEKDWELGEKYKGEIHIVKYMKQ